MTLQFVDQIVHLYDSHPASTSFTAEGSDLGSTRTYFMELHSGIFERYIKTQDIQLLETKFMKEVIDICTIPIRNFITTKRISKGSRAIFNLSSASEQDIIPVKELVTRCRFYLFKDGAPLLEPKDYEDGLISPEVLLKVLRLLSDGISRMLLFYSTDRQVLSEMLESYFSFNIESILKYLVSPGMSFVIEENDVGCASKPFDPKNFLLVNKLNGHMNIIQLFFEDQILSIASSVSPSCCSKLFERKSFLFESLLRLSNELIEIEVVGISQVLFGLISKYAKRSDYKPNADDIAALSSCTPVRFPPLFALLLMERVVLHSFKGISKGLLRKH